MFRLAQPTGKVWKVLQFPLVRVVMASVWIFLITMIAQAIFKTLLGETPVAMLVTTLLIVLIVLGAYYAFVRVIEKRPLSELSVSAAVGELAMGTLVGMVLFTTVIGILWILGYYKVIGTNNLIVVIPMFAVSVLSGVVEEILFRGILFRIAEELLGTWLSLLFSALLFGLMHLGNQNATLWAAIAIAIEAGILLAAAFMVTRRLWLAIGIHFAWNFTQGGIFGVAVSGMQSRGLVQATLSGPDWLTGGAFGAEASVLAIIVCLTAGVYMTWQTVKKGNLVSPIWKRRS